MTKPCPQTDQTMLWIYGESEHDQTTHVAECAACSSLLDDIEVVTAASSGLAPTRKVRLWPMVALAVGMAAVLMLAVSQGPVAPPQPAVTADLLADDPLDDEMLVFAVDVELLSLEFENELL